MIILLPWPDAIGYRRFYQGILIRSNLTRRVAYGTLVRLFSMSMTALLLYLIFDFPGAVVGASALSVGVTLEAIVSRLMAKKAVRMFISIDKGEQKTTRKDLSYISIARFYNPLALTSILSLGVHPIVTFFVGRSKLALESLAMLPVINSLVFIFRGIGLHIRRSVLLCWEKKMKAMYRFEILQYYYWPLD